MKLQQSDKKNKKVVVAVSGGFDPIHPGHTRLFREAKKLGDELVVILNNDNWLKKKKGYSFMSEQERREVIESLGDVDRVLITGHPKNPKDMSVCNELKKLNPDIFANGGDRDVKNSQKKNSSLKPEVPVCLAIGCRMVFNVGKGGKVQSSSWLLSNFLKEIPCQCGSGKKYKECHAV